MELLLIHKTEISPGEQAVVKIPVGRLPSGNQIRMEANVYRAQKEGPTVLVMAGVHGDEINGVEIVRRALASGLFEQLQSGSVVAIPLVNVYGFINFSRAVPDGKDVNRSFPGSMKGSLASRVARALTKKVLPQIDFTVDYHTGGDSLHNHPQIRYSKGHAESERWLCSLGFRSCSPKRLFPNLSGRWRWSKASPLWFTRGEKACATTARLLNTG